MEHITAQSLGSKTRKAKLPAAELTQHIVSEVKRIYGTTISIDREHMTGHCEINSVTRPHCPGELFPYDKLISMVNGKQPDTGAQPPQLTMAFFAFITVELWNLAKIKREGVRKGDSEQSNNPEPLQ